MLGWTFWVITFMSSLLANWLWPSGTFLGAGSTRRVGKKGAVTRTEGSSRKIRDYICRWEDVPGVPCAPGFWKYKLSDGSFLWGYGLFCSGLIYWRGFYQYMFGDRCVSQRMDETHDRSGSTRTLNTTEGKTSPLLYNNGWHRVEASWEGSSVSKFAVFDFTSLLRALHLWKVS